MKKYVAIVVGLILITASWVIAFPPAAPQPPYNQAAVAITGGAVDGTPIGGTTPAVGTFTTLKGFIDEIVQASSDTLTPAELKGTSISNYGQTTANNLQGLPTAAEGMNFAVVCGTAQGAHYFRFQADTSDKIYLNGTAGSDNGYVEIAAPVVGAMIVFLTFQTGATTFDWIASVVSGTWAAG